jgi:hypothetical protein
MNKFKKPEKNSIYNPIDWFNEFGTLTQIFEGDKKCISFSDNEATYPVSDLTDLSKSPNFILNKNGKIDIKKSNPFDLATGQSFSKFILLTTVKFKGDYFQAMSYVSFSLMENEIPYIRVGSDYFKVIKKDDRYSGTNIILKSWKKDEIKEDHTKNILSKIYKFDDFTILPNNKTFIPSKNNCYNLYAKFPHIKYDGLVHINDIQITIGLLNHIFGDQIDLGLKYMKLLYENPCQILPVLSLVSTERETGKTTFLNYIQMLFGENSTLINPSDLMSSFNDAYATKNIIMIDETVIEKQHIVEKLKSLATAKTISVSQKFVQHYSVPFFGKIIVCTNKETDFMRIDDEEIRFWIRKINPIIGKKNTNIESDLFNEIPKFLKYLEQLPEIDLSNSRMVFTQDEIKTDSLELIKKESKNGLRKELEIYIEDFFDNNDCNEFEATAKDIKEKWLEHDKEKMSYILKVLKNEMKMIPQANKYYIPFNGQNPMDKKKGTPFLFIRENNQVIENQYNSIYDEIEPF